MVEQQARQQHDGSAAYDDGGVSVVDVFVGGARCTLVFWCDPVVVCPNVGALLHARARANRPMYRALSPRSSRREHAGALPYGNVCALAPCAAL